MPTYDELLQRYRADGIIPALHQNAQGSQDGPYYSAEIHKVLRSWGDQYGLQLGLGVCTNNGDHRLVSPEETRIWTIWIYFVSENEGWRGVRPLFDGAPIPIPGPIQYTLRFPYGVNVASAGPGPPREDPLHSGIRAIIHSLRNQFFVNQAVSPNLTHDDVLISFQRWIRSRRNFAAAAASTYPSYTMPTPGPLTDRGIAGTLFTWGTRHGYNFDLGVISDDNTVPAYVLPSGAYEPQTIWVLQKGENSHDWRGLTRRGPPTPPNTGPPGSDDSLPDYESD
ncbi:hypothetical protein F4821DRAFT_278240 [Hypoxylon rubiginosum]|uniref:Uncharacterized protein n=1 Tax=Hypoxylon rubiginosum TaxID=110542 RepID=A0ACC0D2E5_9PEZI|nr:hypothetical protein F4821DRAFT_278240 [Hypoxylon rubiginosum]